MIEGVDELAPGVDEDASSGWIDFCGHQSICHSIAPRSDEKHVLMKLGGSR